MSKKICNTKNARYILVLVYMTIYCYFILFRYPIDPRYTFILDAGLTIYIWYSAQSVNTLKSKSRYSISLLNVVITINILKF